MTDLWRIHKSRRAWKGSAGPCATGASRYLPEDCNLSHSHPCDEHRDEEIKQAAAGIPNRNRPNHRNTATRMGELTPRQSERMLCKTASFHAAILLGRMPWPDF
ncbi:hypothetical protein CN243_33605 [Sinorhizobium meliloti]|nr:hypothetical protein CN243_33605 [Sinorhizobium meliloti]